MRLFDKENLKIINDIKTASDSLICVLNASLKKIKDDNFRDERNNKVKI